MKNISNKQLLEFLRKIDNSFSVPLSRKCNLEVLSNKYVTYGTVCSEQCGEEIIGIVAGYIENVENETSYISVVGVLKKAQNKGIANKLLNEYIEICKNKKIKYIHLYTTYDNQKAINLYKRNGFILFHDDNESRPTDIHLILEL